MTTLPPPRPESVWDYPRPPRMEDTSRCLEVIFGGCTVAATRRGQRVLETSHPPVYYFPPQDVRVDLLRPEEPTTFCEWKGVARYFSLEVGERLARRAVWSYPSPDERYLGVAGWYAFYPRLVDECRVDGERVRPQGGGFYGGWITSDIVGPF